MRTLSHIPMQLMNALSGSVLPEISRAFGAVDTPLLRQSQRKSARIAAAMVAASCVGLGWLGETITRLWLGAQQTSQPHLLW
jgi:O-antigen/teichoic acid export membrane protein